MLTGINFSPPLYFLFNFCLQLVFPTSIEQLRIQSLVFIIIGIVLSFLLTRKMFGTPVAFFATILVLSQSYLLLSQAQEARHYAMFFACGAWVLFMTKNNLDATKESSRITFLAHLFLCQVHYLGIVFSGFVGISYLLGIKNKSLIARIPKSLLFAWLISGPSYLFYISSQESLLNYWKKPNSFEHLLSSYNESLFYISIIVPIIGLLLFQKLNKPKKISFHELFSKNRVLFLSSFFWFITPLAFWTLSHISPLNLFVDRYFFPKEVAVIVIVAFFISYICQNFSDIKSTKLILTSSILLCLIFISINYKRAAFGLKKEINYHHSLIFSDEELHTETNIILKDDPNYFPNAYLNGSKFVFDLNDKNLTKIYNDFSSKIKIQ